MRSFILLMLPFASSGLYLVGSWGMYVAEDLYQEHWRRYYGYSSSLMNVIVRSNADWWRRWESHVAMTSLIALSAGIVSLILHLVLPRDARHND